jgi:Uri superfamily endonuclease
MTGITDCGDGRKGRAQSLNGAPISYQLTIEVGAPIRCEVGGLGAIDFPAGAYVYTGSARRGFEARLARHVRTIKTLRWHIDYLLAAPGVRIVGIARSRRDECRLNQASKGRVLVARFGASDCNAGCGAHLKYLGPLTRPLPAE